jgi:hypothetical protein
MHQRVVVSLPAETSALAVPRVRSAASWLFGLLDVVIVATVGAMLAYLVIGPYDAWLFSVSGFAKPFLQSLILVSLRVAIPRPSWLSRSLRRWRTEVAAYHAALSARTSWTPAVVDALVALATTRLISKAVGFVANVLYPQFQPRGFDMPFESAKFAQTFAAWNSGWYFDIAQRGYYYSPDGQSSVAFFPLYPMLMRALAWPFGGSERALWVSGIVLSYVCFFGALVVLHRLTERVTGQREAARRTVLYIAVFPFSFAFGRVYAESLFLFMSVAAVAGAAHGRWALAGGFGALATLARPNGMLIGVPLALMALQGLGGWRDLLRRAVPLAALPVALGLHSLFLYRLSGDPLAWLHAQAQWGYSVGNAPWAAVQRLIENVEAAGIYRYVVTRQDAVYHLLHATVGLAVLALTPSIVGRLGVALGGYVLVGILVPLSGNSIEGIGRYASTLFPVFMYLGMSSSRRVHEALLIGGALWLALLIALFVTHYPVY